MAGTVPKAARWLVACAAAGSSYALDLDPCDAKPAFRPDVCPPGTAVACWSLQSSWSCFQEVPSQFGKQRKADSFCRVSSLSGGSFQGACAFHQSETAKASSSPTSSLSPTSANEGGEEGRAPAPLSWAEAFQLAEETLALMTREEKYSLMQGIGWNATSFDLQKWWYVGNTLAIPRLNIPSFNMQDAAGGFRTYWNDIVGTVTCWPSLLALAATWNTDAVRDFAAALGKEFVEKGANTILGPSVNVHRIARGGRNFEYLSGEDPYLGSRLTEAYLEGVHSQGLVTVAKHWVFNEQETSRGEEASIVDDKTAFELYFPPFQAAVDAGVSAFMCSYNKVGFEHACSSGKYFEVLRNKLGFRGFVQSDWWAADTTAVALGLDQEMPGIGMTHFTPEKLSAENATKVDEAVMRILAVAHRMHLWETSTCTPPHCEEHLRRNVTGPGQAALARALAAESIVLLKNKGGLLPLSPDRVRTIAVLGTAATAQPFNPNGQGQGQGLWMVGDYYAGGGSGHVVAGRVVTPLEGIRKRASAVGIEVLAPSMYDPVAMITAAKQADVVIVVAATTSGESIDRLSLGLDDSADAWIQLLAQKAGVPIVVLVQAPGAVTMPWRDSVDSILAMFLGGQETGDAWADVLFGDHAPTGRLPVMIPETEGDAVQPGFPFVVMYSEGLATSYRNPYFKAAFPFGHGLTYTTFEYGTPTRTSCNDGVSEGSVRDPCVICFELRVANSGQRPGRTVVQLYLEMPPEAQQTAAILKGFQRTPSIAAGASAEVRFCLKERDLSYYDPASPNGGGWVRVDSGTAHFGQSSAGVRQSLPFALAPGPSSRIPSPGFLQP